MKSKILIAGAMLCAITTTGAHAVTKCVALNSSTTCRSNDSLYQNHADWAATCTTNGVADWAATCTTNGVSTPISGIGICSSTQGSGFQTATELDVSPTADENMHCWCKMTSPAVSRWVSGSTDGTASGCAQYCASFCVSNLKDFAGWRSALFGSLSD